jgi:hypothetical protein
MARRLLTVLFAFVLITFSVGANCHHENTLTGPVAEARKSLLQATNTPISTRTLKATHTPHTPASPTPTVTPVPPTTTFTPASPTPSPTPFCIYSLSPTLANFDWNGGSGTVTVTAGKKCTRTSSSNASWIRIISGSKGRGDGTVGYSVSRFTCPGRSCGTRSGTLTIAGETFTVSQRGLGLY